MKSSHLRGLRSRSPPPLRVVSQGPHFPLGTSASSTEALVPCFSALPVLGRTALHQSPGRASVPRAKMAPYSLPPRTLLWTV